MYKLTRPDGFDFYSQTINYRDAIGSIVRVLDYDPPEHGVCGRGLHASKNPNDCFIGAKIPCSAFRVQGVGKIATDHRKTRYKGLKVIEEITDLNNLFGWLYSEATNPIHPFKIIPPKIDNKIIGLLREWGSVGDSVWDSMRGSVRDSVRDSVGDSVWDSVGDSVWGSVRGSVWDSVWGYIGSFFPLIHKWKYVSHKKGEYPFQSGNILWRMGIVPSFDEKKWRLHGGPKGEILWEGKIE